ncbi:hypothetical protein GE061_001457 [Apolygus lucorum]|uniref:Peptidase C1A papain C-terminal domain-containing protein n=1 Tax=Apolygus lucorum TaxID=248454 RepID=A0A8S9Y8L5_APOLU|nr:hypothetical protein GE061_001457 [Apolygus lucorum]
MVSPTISTTSCVLCVAILALSSASTDFDRIIDEVNNANTTWRAGPNFRPDYSLESIKRLLGNRELPGVPVGPRNLVTYSGAEIPAEFDSRKKWPNCPTISHILDQSGCGSCWAVSVASVFSDRLCIGTNGKFTSPLSAEDLMSCCPSFECNGGNDGVAWTYVQNHGIVTGGDFNSSIGCQPYTFPPCEHHVNGARIPCDQVKIPNGGVGPACQKKCTNADYKTSFANDKHKVITVNQYDSVESAQEDIMKNGPIQAGFVVYSDFMHYKSGVYKHVTGSPLGGHSVRVLGWGVEEGTPYWLVANSWNSDWGDKGLFKIQRGTDECAFEDQLMAGEPSFVIVATMVSPTISITKCVLYVAILALSSASTDFDRIIDEVNNANTTWRAGPNFRPDYPLGSIKRLLGNLEQSGPIGSTNLVTYSGTEIPAEFDSRKEWPNCPTISHILDQSHCGSCWAVSIASTMSDRLCVATKGKFTLPISAEHLMSCSVLFNFGCYGGIASIAWNYIQNYGLPTGGDFNSKIGCIPYELPSCEHGMNGTRISCDKVKEPFNIFGLKCHHYCTNKDYKTSYDDDFHKVKKVNEYDSVESAQEDIMKNGPIQTGFAVYADFVHYKSGVYKHVTGGFLGRHAVRVLGWGVEEGTPYWLVANSWNSDWGDKGLFKIQRGSNECDFEKNLMAGDVSR